MAESDFRNRHACQALFGSCLTLVVGFGVLNTLGLFEVYVDIELENSPATTGWIFSFASTFWQLIGFLSGGLTSSLGHRKTILIGGLSLFFGQLWSCFATDIYQYFISIGLLTSFGISICFNAGLSVINVYFKEGFPVAISIAGLAIGAPSTVFPFIFKSVINRFGCRGAFLIQAGVCLNVCVASILFHPAKASENRKDHGNLWTNIKEICFDVPGLHSFFMTTSLIYVSYMTWVTLAVPYAMEIGIESLSAVSLMSAYGVGMISGRVGQLVITALIVSEPMLELVTGICLATLSLALFSIVKSFYILVGCSLLFGVALGFLLTSFSSILQKLSVGRSFEVFTGVSSTFCGIVMLCFGGIFGYFRAMFGNYHVTFIAIALTTALPLVLILSNKTLFDMLPLPNKLSYKSLRN